MKITNVKINLMPGHDPLKAFASITFEDCFVVHDLRIIKTDNKMFVAMPSKQIRTDSGKSHKDIAHPINADTRKEIETKVLEEYQKTVESV